ncbi:hypothetical protein N7523_009155 [Penicillium sp. IBT 18751x]|nr:hypothetical protein N7523_009155 [Penicillium sp. IBT 18751x]
MPASADSVDEAQDAPSSGQEAAVDSSESGDYTPSSPINGLTANDEDNSVNLPTSIRSDSSGSAMDESVDHEHDTSFEGTNLYGFQDTPPASAMEEQMTNGHVDHSVREELPMAGSEEETKASDLPEDSAREVDNVKIQRESSPESDFYEPPEPEAGAEELDPIVEENDAAGADESYSPPPFSPAPVEDLTDSPPPRDQDLVEESAESPRSRAQPQNEALTWARPGPYFSEPRRDFQIGIFGV